MFQRLTPTALLVLAATSLLGGSGCSYNLAWSGPEFGLATFPIPVSPYFQDRKEDKFWINERYERVPILGPITHGPLPVALDPPSDDQVVRAMPTIEGGIPFLHEKQRNNVRIIKELMCEYVDPPRVYPLIGPAQLHHAHYKCTIYYSETTHHGWPLPHTNVDEDSVQVIYIDHNHLHMVGNVQVDYHVGPTSIPGG